MPKPLPKVRPEVVVPLSCTDCRIVHLVSLALSQDGLTGIHNLLEGIAAATDVYGCILWKMEPGPTPHGPPNRLYVLAQWFQDDASCVMHDLPLEGSLTGKAIETGDPQISNQVPADSRVFHDHRFLREHDIQGMCSLPLIFMDQTKGALNLYRLRGFSAPDVQIAREVSKLIPQLYRTLLDRASARLLHRIQELFERGEPDGDSKLRVLRVLRGVVGAVQDELSCLEVTLFLEDERQRPETYARLATTWHQRGPKLSTPVVKGEGTGPTAWVLNHGEELRLFDLRRFERDRASIQRRYPGLEWEYDPSLDAQVRERLDLGRELEACPPLSFMCSPIRAEGRTIGALHCFAPTGRGPHFYASQEQAILGLVAQQIGQRWLHWVDRRNLDEENASWKALVKSVTGLNRFVYDELRRDALDEKSIFEKALEVTQTVIEGAETTDVRLHDEATNELYFEAVHGDAWNNGSRSDREERLSRRFPLEEPYSSAGAWVFHNNEVRQIDDITKDSFYDGTFTDTRRMLIAPISVEDRVFGVLDIRGTTQVALPPHAKDIAELLGKQLGIYHYLASTIKQLNEVREYQRRAIEDLTHQLRNPLAQAHQRVQRVLREARESPGQHLWAVRGLVAKAHRVAQSTKLFVELSRNEAIQPKLEDVDEGWLIPLLIEAAEDAEILLDLGRNLRVDVQREDFQDLPGKTFRLDRRLLEQAVKNILDNACKYSYSNSTVHLFGGPTKSGQLQIAVANKGIPLTSMDARAAKEREWRSDLAEYTTAEGSGLGLWIVDHIMKAHQGTLQIEPTDREGWTLVRLLFPAQGD